MVLSSVVGQLGGRGQNPTRIQKTQKTMNNDIMTIELL